MLIANKPLISYQIKYLEANNQFDIYVVVPSNNYLKVERYLHDHFEPDPRSNIFVVVVLEEETRTTESANALKMMAALHAF
jgi:NDP-sugar pyrophosphorylase family protein